MLNSIDETIELQSNDWVWLGSIGFLVRFRSIDYAGGFLGFVFQKWFAFIRCIYIIELSLKTYGGEKLRFTAKIPLNTYAISYSVTVKIRSSAQVE